MQITEEMNLHKDWHDEASKQTLETLANFLNKLANDYEHDYGTICHAIAASAIAAAKAMNKSSQGGITGFQAGCVMWEFIRQWMHIDGPARLIEYEDMLYPQYREKFEKIISRETADLLIDKAKELLNKNKKEDVNINIWGHWITIAAGIIPFGYSIKSDD